MAVIQAPKSGGGLFGNIGGMLASTLMGIFFTPLFYLSVRHWLNRDRPVHAGPAREGPATDDRAGGAHEQ